MTNNTLMLFCDGLCEPRNPGGWACWAWLARSPKGNRLREDSGCLGHGDGMTNNLAEYRAVIEALTYTLTRAQMLYERQMGVTVYADSQLVIRQITGEYATRQPHLIELRKEVLALADELGRAGVPVEFIWMPREENADADTLTRKAYQEARRRQPVPDLL